MKKNKVLFGIILSITSGFLLTISFAPYNIWPVVFIAFIPQIIAQYKFLPKRLSSLAPAFMVSTWLFLYFGPSFFGQGIMLLLPIIGFIIDFFGEKSTRTFNEKTKFRWFILHGAVSWVGFEIIRTFIPGIATWGFVNYTLWSQTWLIQPVSIFSIYGLSFLIMIINYSLGLFVLTRVDNTKSIYQTESFKKLKLVGIITGLWIVLSICLYISKPEDDEKIRVAAVQPGITEVAFQNPDMDHLKRLKVLKEYTEEAASMGAKIVVWSELFLPFDPQFKYTEELRRLASDTDTYIILPYGVFEKEGLRNESIILAPNGEFSDIYAKAHPVLFAGEPYGLNVGTFPVFETAIGTLATMICYDLNYTDVSKRLANKGAQIITAPASDWPGIAEKQNIHLVFRAIENRVAIINSEKAFDSAIVDPYGHILEETVSVTPEKAILVADIPISTETTIYQYLGDWFGWLTLIGMLMFMFFSKKLIKKEQAK